MLKGQDIVLLLKLLANAEHLNWPQQKLATHLCLSVSAINASLMRLRQAKLLTFNMDKQRYQIILKASQELLVHSVKYFFPANLGEYTIGMSTSYAAPLFSKHILLNQEEPSPVWPHIKGEKRGLALAPLYHCVPDALIQYPDESFYEFLVLVDAIRQGRARERGIAVNLLKEKIEA